MLGYHTNISDRVSQTIRNEMKVFTITVTQLLSRLGSIHQDSQINHLRTRDQIWKEICQLEDLRYHGTEEITAGIEVLNVSGAKERNLTDSIRNTLVESLSYAEMTYRYEDLVTAHPATFEWALKAPTEKQSWHNLSDWLKFGSAVYWVSGKAGSGKSTLMRYLVDTKRLEEYLGVWVGKCPLSIATFFFWNSGTSLQKSQLGFLRALLYQVLKQSPDLVPVVFPREWAKLYSNATRERSDESHSSGLLFRQRWTLDQLQDALRALSNQSAIPLKTCIIIDGIDEFDGDHEEMGRLFKERTASNQIKVCLSSRPWVVLEELFGSCPKLKLEDLTYRDIQQYVRDKFYQNNAFLRLANVQPTEARALLDEIIEKADGVFLWVKLVVRSLLDGLRNRDELADLQIRLRLLPRELKPLYVRLLELIDPVVYLPWTSQAIQILRCNRALCNASSSDESRIKLNVRPLTISDFSLAMSPTLDISEIENMTRKVFQLRCEDTKVRLTARCAGFLEVSNIHGTSTMGPGSLIQYFHRTAKDFLESEEVWARLLSKTSQTDFNPNVAMMRSSLWYIRIQIAFSAESAQRFIRYEIDASTYVTSFLAYATSAEPDIESREAQTALIDQLDDLISENQNDEDWLYEVRPRRKGRCKMLEISTVWGLRGYVRDRLRMIEAPQLTTAATSLLQFFLSDEFSGLERYPFPSLEMVSLLLDFGADAGNSSDSPSGALESAYRGLEFMMERTAADCDLCRQSDSNCAQNSYVRIIETLRGRQPVPAVRINTFKRATDEIEDHQASTRPNKIRKWREDIV
jgi:hypothetical protein